MDNKYLSRCTQLILWTMIIVQCYAINSKRDFVASDCLNPIGKVKGWNDQWADTIYYVNGVVLSATEVKKILPEQIVSRSINQHVVEINIKTLYYINERLSTKEKVDLLSPDTIENMNVIKYGNAIPGLVKIQLIKPSKKANGSDDAVRFVQQMPQFPDGDAKLLQWIHKNLVYPEEALNKRIEGRVIMEFQIEKDGSITHPKVSKGIGYGCDEEALRLINKMQSDNIKWKPGKNNGREVIVVFTLPIGFKL